MKILITGYRGFIGQNMTEYLAGHDLTFHEWGDTLPNVRGLDWVIHLGANSSTTEKNVELIMQQNYDFSCWLLNECWLWQVNFQYASSASVYGLTQNFSENSPVSPQSPYAWSKYLFERYVCSRAWKGIYIQGFRYFNVYGPREDHKGDQASPYHKFKKQAQETGVIKLFENSDQYLRDFVPVETVVDVHKKFFNVKESGIWNVGTGQPRSFQAVAEDIAKEYNAVIEYIPMPDNVKGQYQTYTCADTAKLKKHYSI
jgi:ADP-L-glycero-D-manno-heptose 6-epimerase